MKTAIRGSVPYRAQPRTAGKTSVNRARRAELGELKRMRTRAALLEAAISVLGSESGRVATVDNVISEAGVARGTFYNYFEGREQLLDAVAYELSHDFNSRLRESLAGEANAAKRSATWIRQYLRRVRADRQWGWAIVNVSLNGPKLLGEESYDEALRTIADGCATNVFKVSDRSVALDLALGGLLACAITILKGAARDDYPEVTAQLILRSLGVPDNQALRIVSLPLADLPAYTASSAVDGTRSP